MLRRSGKNGPFPTPKQVAGEPQGKKRTNANPSVQTLSADARGQDSVVRIAQDCPEPKRPAPLGALMANALSQLSDAVITTDIEHRITYLNRTAERLYGFTVQEVRGRAIEDVYQQRWSKPEDEKAAYNSLASIGSWRGENLHITKSAEEIFVDLSVSLLKDETGSPIGFLTVARDITERKRAEDALGRARDESELRIRERTAELAKANEALQAELAERQPIEAMLRERETRLLHIYNSATDLMFLLSVESEECFRYLSVNKSFLARTGFSEAQLIGKRVEEVLPELAVAFLRTKWGEAIRAGKSVQYEVTIDLPLGRRSFETTLTPIFDQTGKCAQIFGVTHDFTARKQAEDALRQLSGRLLRLQDEERRRLGCELHDTLGQNLTALETNLAIMQESVAKLNQRTRAALTQ